MNVYTYCLGTICGLHTAAIEEETDRGGGFSLTFAEGVHQLLQLGGPLDLEKDLIVVVCDLDIEMLALSSALGLFWSSRAAVVIGAGHFMNLWLEKSRYLTRLWRVLVR